MQREFPLGQRRVCPDVCRRQTCRRPHCECTHPDFVDHAWVPLNSLCRNFFRGHCAKEGGCPNLHADTFPEAVYAAFRQLTMKRPSTRLHYVQHRGIFRFVTRSEAMDMIMTSLTTSDTMAIKQFIMGMSCYENHLARGGVPATDPRTSRGGYGRHSHRTRSPTPTRSRFPSPRRNRSASATPLSGSTSAASEGMPKDPPAHLAAPKRTPSPHNKQPARPRAQSPTARFMPQATEDGGSAQHRKAPPPLPPDSDEDTPPATVAAMPRKAPPAALNTTTPVQGTNSDLVQDDHDPWNDFSQQRADPIVELVTPAVALYGQVDFASESAPRRTSARATAEGGRPFCSPGRATAQCSVQCLGRRRFHRQPCRHSTQHHHNNQRPSSAHWRQQHRRNSAASSRRGAAVPYRSGPQCRAPSTTRTGLAASQAAIVRNTLTPVPAIAPDDVFALATTRTWRSPRMHHGS